MKICRAGKNTEIIRNKIICAALFLFTIIGMAAVILHISENMTAGGHFNPYDTFSTIGIVVLTITLFAGFFFLGVAKGRENQEKLNAFAITDDGKLLRLFYEDSDVRAGNTIPFGFVGKLVSISENARTIRNINNRAEFLVSSQLADYVEGVLDGTTLYMGKVRIDYIQNPKIKQISKNGMEIYYTQGEYQRVASVILLTSYEGYDLIHDLIVEHPSDVDYTGKKVGDYLIQAKE